MAPQTWILFHKPPMQKRKQEVAEGNMLPPILQKLHWLLIDFFFVLSSRWWSLPLKHYIDRDQKYLKICSGGPFTGPTTYRRMVGGDPGEVLRHGGTTPLDPPSQGYLLDVLTGFLFETS